MISQSIYKIPLYGHGTCRTDGENIIDIRIGKGLYTLFSKLHPCIGITCVEGRNTAAILGLWEKQLQHLGN